jgi:hypothetical protein
MNTKKLVGMNNKNMELDTPSVFTSVQNVARKSMLMAERTGMQDEKVNFRVVVWH